MKYQTLTDSKSAMADSEWSLPAAWKDGELTPDGIRRCHHHLLPEVEDLENDLGSVEKSVKDYLDALSTYCNAGSQLSSTFSKLLGDTTLSNISQQYQQVTEQLEHSAHESSVEVANCVLATLCDFTSTLPEVKQKIEKYKRCKNRYEKCREGLESFAQKDASASEGKRFQLARERFHMADKECTRQQEQLSQCLSALEGNRIKMLGASLLSFLSTLAQFFGSSSTMLAPLGEYQTVGDYLQDREIAPQLKEATTAWCSVAQSYQLVRDSEYLSGEEIYKLLEHKNGEELTPSEKEGLANHLKTLLKKYKKEVEDIEDGPVVVPGGFFKNPAGIGLALKGCCSRLEILALNGIRESVSLEEMVSTLKLEIPKIQLTVGSVGKPWCKVSNLKDADVVLSRQHCIQALVEPLAKQFDIPFTKESLESFTVTVLNEACSEKTILASKIAVQLMYGKSDLVVVKLCPESTRSRSVRINCRETSVNIEVQLTWWVTSDQTLFSDILNEDEIHPLFQVDTTYCTMIDYMDYLEEKESRLPSITVEFRQVNGAQNGLKEEDGTLQSSIVCNVPVAPPRTKHYAKKIAARRQKKEMDIRITRSVGSMDERKSTESSERDKAQEWFSLSSKLPSREPAFTSTTSHLSLASESELSEVINFLSGLRHRGLPDADEGDTESLCSVKAMSDSGIESVKNAKLAAKANNGGEDPALSVEEQTKGKKGKKKEKKGTTKSESFSKKKRKKRGDKAKKEKKKTANAVIDEQGETNTKDTKDEGNEKKKKDNAIEVGEKQKGEKPLNSQSKISVAVDKSSVQNPEASGQESVILSESLRSVWEQGEKNFHQPDPTPPSNLSLHVPNLATQAAALCSSQDSIYYSCWSLPSLVAEPDEPKSSSVVNADVPSDFNLDQSWSKGYEQESSSNRDIWSADPKFDKYSRREATWTPSLRRQRGVDCEDNESTSLVGESVFSLGLGVTGFELFAAANQARLASSGSKDDKNERFSSLDDNRNTTSQSPMWPPGKLTAGQFTEKSSSCGEGLHLPHNYFQDRVRLQTHHSDPFLAKDVSWAPPVPPMYMKVRYNPNLIAPFPIEDVPVSYGSSQQTRTAPRLNHPVQPLTTTDQRRTLPRFYVPSGHPRAGPL